MGTYPQIELTLASIEKQGHMFNQTEINQPAPRHLKNNLIHHKIHKIKAGHLNTALITDKGELLLQGMNNCAQLPLPMEISKRLGFFPDFMKIDALKDYLVRSVAFGSATVHAVC